MKTRKMFSVVLVLLMLAGLMTAATAGAVDINEVTEGYYTGLVGPVTNESDDTSMGYGFDNSNNITCSDVTTEDGNTFITGSRTAHTVDDKNFIYPYQFGYGNTSKAADFVFGEGSGEYIVQTKVKWNQPEIDSTKVYRFKIDLNTGGLYYEFGQSASSTQFNANDDTTDYILMKNSSGSGIAKLADGTTNASIKLQNDTWYTIRVVCNLDETSKTIDSRLEIDDANGNNLITTAESEHTYTADQVGFYRFYANIHKQSSNPTDPISCSFDDFMVVKSVKKPVTVTYDETKGTVSYNNTKAVSGEKTAVNYNENAVFTVSPKAGYKVNQVLVDGEEVTVAEDGTVTLTTVTDAHEISVTFKDASREYIIEPIDNTTRKVDGTFASDVDSITVSYPSEDGNDYWLASRSDGGSLNNPGVRYPAGDGSFACDNGKTVFLSEDGTYVVETKVRFDALGTTASTHNFYSNIKIDGGSVLKNYAVNGTPGDDSEESITDQNSETVGTVALDQKAWYTVRFVYKLNNKTAKTRMEIESADGSQLLTSTETEFTYETSIQILRLVAELLGQKSAETTLRPSIAIDDFCIYKVVEEESQPETASVTVTYNEGGSVTYNGETITSGEAAAVAYNEDATFGIAANEGYEIESILVNGESVAVKDSVVLEKVKTDQTLAVTFKEKAIVAPAVDSDTVPQYVFNSENTSQVAYFVINPGYGYTFTDGIAKLYEIGNSASEEAPLKLESTEMLSDYANKDWDGRYGVRIHGTGLTVGNSYVLAPYWVAESGEESTVIDPVKEGDTEKYTFSFGTDK